MSYTYKDFVNDFPKISDETFFYLRNDGLYLADSPVGNLPDELKEALEAKDREIFTDHPDGMPNEPILEFGKKCTREDVVERFVCYYGMLDFCINEKLTTLAIIENELNPPEEIQETAEAFAKKINERDYGVALTGKQDKQICAYRLKEEFGAKKGRKKRRYLSVFKIGQISGIIPNIKDEELDKNERDRWRKKVRDAIKAGEGLYVKLSS